MTSRASLLCGWASGCDGIALFQPVSTEFITDEIIMYNEEEEKFGVLTRGGFTTTSICI